MGEVKPKVVTITGVVRTSRTPRLTVVGPPDGRSLPEGRGVPDGDDTVADPGGDLTHSRDRLGLSEGLPSSCSGCKQVVKRKNGSVKVQKHLKHCYCRL